MPKKVTKKAPKKAAPKVAKKAAPKKVVKKAPRAEVKVVEKTSPKKVEPKKEPLAKAEIFPKVDNSQVVEILSKGDMHYHCRCSDGTTRHVPKELF